MWCYQLRHWYYPWEAGIYWYWCPHQASPLTMNWLTVQCVYLELARRQRLKKLSQSILSWHSIPIPHQGRLVQVEPGQVLRHMNQYTMIVKNSTSNNGMDNTAWRILLLIFEKTFLKINSINWQNVLGWDLLFQTMSVELDCKLQLKTKCWLLPSEQTKKWDAASYLTHIFGN